ncbi:MAG: hypothetical protein QMB52_07495 [Propionivibrio sp.]
MQRREFVSYLVAAACDCGLAMAAPAPVRGKASGATGGVPAWAPAPGEIRNVSYAPRMHPLGAGATLAEIDPKYQAWNPEAPRQGPYKATEYYWGSVNGYSGICWNTDTRQLVNYGAGHASINVCAPFCFDLNDLRWKWLDTPLPFDGYGRVRTAGGISEPPPQSAIDRLYPNGEIDYSWGELNGDSPGWEAQYGRGPWLRPGKIQPIPGHTRNVLGHVPASIMGNGKGGLFKFGSASGVLGGTHSIGSHIFDHDTATWRRTANQPPNFRGSTTAQSTIVDAQTGTVIHYGGGQQFKVFDFSTDAWRPMQVASNAVEGSTDAGNVLALPPGRLLVAAFARDQAGRAAYYNGKTFVFCAVDIDAVVGKGIFSLTTLSVDARAWPLNSAGNNTGIGWGFCPENASFYCVNGEHQSPGYWRLAPPAGATRQSHYLSGTWTLTQHSFVSGTLSSPGHRSWVFNRLSWDPASRSFLWFPDDVNGPVQAFRPAEV